MRRWLIVALAAAGAAVASCGDDGGVRHTADALIDTPIDSPAGSGVAHAGEFEASPSDVNLEIGVLVLAVFVIAMPASLRSRRNV